MPEFIRRRERVTKYKYSLHFAHIDHPSSGWGPECDENGNVDVAAMNDIVRKEWERVQACIANGTPTGYFAPEIFAADYSYWESAAIRCKCGAEVTLPSASENDCDKCDRLYNGFGQELAPREQWGEETGETYSDIVRGHNHYLDGPE